MERFKTAIAELHSSHPNACGRVYSLIVAFGSAGQVIAVKFVNKKLSFAIIGSFQGSIGFIITYLIYGRSQNPYPHDAMLNTGLFLRGLLGASVNILFTLALKILPAQKNILLINTSSMWVILFGIYFLKEYPNLLILSMAALIFLGVVLLIDPGLILPGSWVSSPQVGSDKVFPIYYYLMPVAAGFGAAGVTTFIKANAGKITPYMNTYWFFLFANFWMGVSMLFMSLTEESAQPSLKDIFFISLMSIGGNLCQICLPLATRYEKRISIVSMFASTQIVFTYLFDYLLFGNAIEAINVLGGIIIVLATLTIAFSKESQTNTNNTNKPEVDTQK